MSYILFSLSPSLLSLDARFHAQPLRGRKSFSDHLIGKAALVILIKNCALQYAKLLSDESSPPPPTDDAGELARFTARLIAVPVVKDVLTSTTARVYEWLLIERIYAADMRKAGSFVRGASLHGRGARRAAMRREGSPGV